MELERECNECGSDDWNKIVSKQYPESRSRDRDKTQQEIYRCKECGAQGKRFEDGPSGRISYSGELR